MSTFNPNQPPDMPQPPSTPPPAAPPTYSQSALPQPPAPQEKSRVWLWAVIGGGAFFLFVMAVFTLVYLAVKNDHKASAGLGGFGDKIAVVEIEGVIIESKETLRQLKRYNDDDSIKAIILDINTPGGGAEASQEIYQTVHRIADKHNKEKKKPIVASIRSVGASGGYYIASGTNKIFASDASIVGSIGVIASWVNYGELLKWAKLKDVTFKAGELKDAGNPAREMTPAEQAYLQDLIDNMHAQFIRDVATGRGAKVEDIRAIANGRVWTGQQALPMKLIDKIGDFQDALEDTAKSVGIKGEPTIVRPEKEKKTLLDILFGDVSDLLPDRAKMMQDQVGFYYLWKM